jgi:uncharacterized protein
MIGIVFLLAAALAAAGCQRVARMAGAPGSAADSGRASIPITSPVIRKVVEDAIAQTEYTIYYDQSYVRLDYPGGDVPLDRGACSDVIIRAFRKGGVDLQKEIHEDMALSFGAYPRKWGLARPDTNIDHRRVPNMMTYFARRGRSLQLSRNPADYLPGDVVAWDLGGGTTHIGLVTNILSETSAGGYLVAHNIGSGVRVEDVLLRWEIIGHYRYFQSER